MKVPEFFSHYQIVKKLKGSDEDYVQVFLAVDSRDNKTYACKAFDRNYPSIDLLEQELRIQESMNHPNILPIVDVVYEIDIIIAITRFILKGDLLNVLTEQRPGFMDIVKMFLQVVNAVIYMHERDIAHLDIKLDNIYVDESNNAYLADFGCCETPISRRRPFYGRGTLIYSAPEMLSVGSLDNKPADIWSLGILLFIMVTNRIPWIGNNDEDIMIEISSADIKYPSLMNEVIQDVVCGCCKVNPKDRISLEDIINKINGIVTIRAGEKAGSMPTTKMPSKKSLAVKPLNISQLKFPSVNNYGKQKKSVITLRNVTYSHQSANRSYEKF